VTPDRVPEILAPLTTEAIATVLRERGYRFELEPDGSVSGQWGAAVMHFTAVGGHREVLHIRAAAQRRYPTSRRAELYAFCNAWNHDRLLPKAYVHEFGDELVVLGEVTTDLEHGVSNGQLTVLIRTAISASAGLVEALDQLPA
jgi:hypothetical protein